MTSRLKRQRVFETPWFRVVAAEQPEGAPYYMLELQDYVSVVALTTSGRMLLVRQFRPVAGDYTLELPSGHMEPGETPEQAARRELLEETGCVVAGELELMGTLIPDVGRLANRMHCYFARGVRPSPVPAPREAGVTAVEWSVRDVLSGTVDGRIDHALNLAVLMLAVTTGRLTLRDREELK